ncbi:MULTISPECIES: hypothetical protein [unclassified Bradyrhizobium]|uniref:hypothetical protein n=1 Tax=unclassified Bradyrhizobium TaxID=2631580 RepID=UPI00070AE724|nr:MULTISPECIES: hypothetical protein [unclassified Bradyrhizobium]KQT12898.1 hypothetical protein ASG57_08065 [Bradyrhizobium sp. Leaf396]
MDTNFNSNSEHIEQPGEPEPCISKARLKREGWREVRAFIEPTEPAASTKKEKPEARTDGERKADQRRRQHADGLRQINVVAPEDNDARALIMQVAKAVGSKAVRRDIAAVLADRDLVKIARRVRRLRGSEADQARALLKL